MSEDQFDNLMNAGAVEEEGQKSGDSLVLDLGNVDESAADFQPMPAGIYNAIVENVEFKTSSSGNPMLAWQFKVTDEEYDKRMLFFHTVLNSERGQATLKKVLVRILPDFPLGAFNPQQFADDGVAIGQEARVKVNIRPYNGEKRNNVQEVLAPETGSDFL